MWVSTLRIPPPQNKTVSVRFGASVCFAAYSVLRRKWFLVAGSYEEEIAAPSLWFCTDPERLNNKSDQDYSEIIPQTKMRPKKKAQLELNLA